MTEKKHKQLISDIQELNTHVYSRLLICTKPSLIYDFLQKYCKEQNDRKNMYSKENDLNFGGIFKKFLLGLHIGKFLLDIKQLLTFKIRGTIV